MNRIPTEQIVEAIVFPLIMFGMIFIFTLV